MADITAFLDSCQTSGMWGIPNLGHSSYFLTDNGTPRTFSTSRIVDVLNADIGDGHLLKDHPALFCYQVTDEPNVSGAKYVSPDQCTAAANAIRGADPDRLVWVNLAGYDPPSAMYDDYFDSQDMWSFDTYPLGARAPEESMVEDGFDPYTECTDADSRFRGSMPLGTVLQGYQSYATQPTPAMFRGQAYGFIMHDYRFFPTYAWKDLNDNTTLIYMPDLWDYMREINCQMLTLKSMIVDTGLFSPVSCTGTKAPNGDALDARDVDVRKKVDSGYTYVIAVNGLGVTYPYPNQNLSATVSITGLTEFTWAERLFEGTQVGITNGTLTDYFGPYAVHVYKLH